MMNILKIGTPRTAQTTDNSRRSFIWKLGAGASAALVSTAAMAQAATRAAGDPLLRAAVHQDEKLLRRLHRSFEQAMDQGLHEAVIGMFADDAEVVFNGGVFSQRNQGVSRLFRERFAAGKSGRRMQPAPGFELSAEQERDSVEVSADQRSAQALFPYSIQVGMPFQTESSLAAMARMHGEGVRTWWEGGVYRVRYARDVAGGGWKISRLEYDTLSRADYRPGKSYARPITVAPLAMRFPQDQHGPDGLI